MEILSSKEWFSLIIAIIVAFIAILGAYEIIKRIVVQLKNIKHKLKSYNLSSLFKLSPKENPILKIGLIITAIVVIINLMSSRGEELLVTRIIDGDTFVVQDGRTVRIIGINTPELPYDYYSVQSKNELSRLIDNKRVKIDFEGKGKYGRELGYVYKNGKSINEHMVENGFAVSYRKYPHKYTKRYNRLENKARKKKKGLWKNLL